MIDLHIHTIESDGEMTPKKIIDMAIEKKIKAIAITDHDTIDGIELATEYSKGKDIKVISGIEIDTETQKGELHILGLNIDYNNNKLKKRLDELKVKRNLRNDKFIYELNKMGFDITLEDLKQVSNGKIISKPHFAKVFLKKGYIKEKKEMFDKYFNQSPLRNYKKELMTTKEAIELINIANGIAILAHPQSLKLDDNELIEKVRELKSYGLEGIECYHSNQTREQMNSYRKIAENEGLLITKGSDYHGSIVKPDIELGTGISNNIVNEYEDEILFELLKRMERSK